MDRRSMLRFGLLPAAALLTAGAARAASGAPAVAPSGGGSPSKPMFPNVEVVDHLGRTHRLYDDLIKGKLVVLSFFYMACTDGVCPTQTRNLVEVQKLLAERGVENVNFYSITLRPETDTPALMAQYAEGFGLQPGFLLLRTRPDQIELVRRWLGYVEQDLEKDADRSSHVGMVRYGNEAISRWSACPAALPPKQIANSIALVTGRSTADRLPPPGTPRNAV